MKAQPRGKLVTRALCWKDAFANPRSVQETGGVCNTNIF